ncbi:putative alpha-glycosyltransferase/ family 4 [Synechococcus sp. BOUM118]|nr:putative alpha-glycosyltransferase/ family 4 [Synechococcus sp. BOUM118]
MPDAHRAAAANLRGKLALLNNAIAEAIPQLALAVSLETESAANEYMLGAALVRQQQWLVARTCLQRALRLQPGLSSARLELATVLLATGEPAQALSVLQPLPHGSNLAVIAKRAQIDVQLAEYGSAAAQVAVVALQGPVRLPEPLLRERLQIAGGLLLAEKFTEARAWLQALTTVTTDPEALANPIPRRIAWIALAALELIETYSNPLNFQNDVDVPELQNLQWQQASVTECSLWSRWLEPLLEQLASRLERQPYSDQEVSRQLLTAILEALSSLLPAQQRQSSLIKRLEQCRDGRRPFVHSDAGSHRAARARLHQASDALLNHLPLLVVHPAAELLAETQQRRRQGLDQLWRQTRGVSGWYLPCGDDAGLEWIDELNACV